MNRFKSLLSSTYFVTFGFYGLIQVSGLANSVVLARALGPEGRGEVAAVVLWGTLIATLANLGTAEAVLYYGAQPEHATGDVYFTGLVLVLFYSIPALILGYLLMPLLLSTQRPEVVDLARIFLVFIPFGMLSGNSGNLIRSQLHIHTYNLLILIVPLGMTIGICVLAVVGGLTVDTAVVLQLVLSIMTTVIAMLVVLRYRLLSHFSIKPGLFRKMFWYGTRVHIGTLSSVANLRLDQVLLAGLTNPTSLGLYVVAVKVSSVSSVLAPIVTTIAVPQVASKAEKSLKILEFLRIFRLYWLLSVVFKFLFVMALPLAIPLIYGGQFREALLVSIVLVLASLFYDARSIMAGGAQAMNDPWLASRAELVSSTLNLVLLAVLLPFGIIGAALASLGAYFASFLITVRGLVNRHKITLGQLFSIREGFHQLLGSLGFNVSSYVTKDSRSDETIL